VPPSKELRRKPRDLGKSLSRMLGALFALVGLLPLLLGVLVRTTWVRAQAADLAQRMLLKHLSLEASFQVDLEVLPPSLVLRDLRVPAWDGGTPAIEVDRVQVAPRLFSLLGGRPDVGDIEIERPRVRLVVEGGELRNVRFKAPPSDDKPREPLARLPFRTLSITQASAQVSLDDQGVAFDIDDLDVDVSASDGPEIEGALSLGGARVLRRRALAAGGEAVDNDVVCGLRARVHYNEGALVVRRLDLSARLDADETDGAYPSCAGASSGEELLEVSLSRLRVAEGAGPFPVVSGHVAVQLPLRAVGRAVPTAPLLSGDAGLDVDVAFSGQQELPVVHGRLTAHEVMLFGLRTVAHTLDARIESDVAEARMPEGHVAFAGGEVVLRNVRAQPLAPGVPIEVGECEVRRLRFPQLLGDIGITRHTIVQWTLESGGITNFKGHVIDPVKKGPSFLGDVNIQTSGFEITTGAWDDPARKHVVAVRSALVKGKFGVESYGVVMKNMTAGFGGTRLDVPSVTIGFEDALEVRIGEGTHIDFADITPVVTLPLGGKIDVKGLVHGGQDHPRIDGEIRATNLRMADLPLADVMTSKVEFQPFTLEFKGAKAQKGRSSYEASLIRVDLNRTGVLAVDGQVSTKAMDFRDLLSIFTFENDPRFSEISGQADARASLHFESGGPADVCQTGVISVRAQADLGLMRLYGETYEGGDADLDFTWFDRAALERGMEATLRSLTLRKGRGTIIGAGSLLKGGALRGHFVAHDVPLVSIEAMGPLRVAVDGTVSAVGQVGGTIEDTEVDASVQLSPVRVGQRILPPSQVSLRLVPTPRAAPAQPQPHAQAQAQVGQKKLTRCGGEIPGPFLLKEYEKDQQLGVFHAAGSLFGGQITFDDYAVTRQRSKVAWGKLAFSSFDLGALFQFSPAFALADSPPRGSISGLLEIERMELEHLENTRVRASVERAEVARGPYKASLRTKREGAAGPVEIVIADDTLTLPPASVALAVGGGLAANVSIGGHVRGLTGGRELALEARLAPLDISTVLATMPRVEAASGKLEATLAISGPAASPTARGDLRLRDGALQVRGAPVSLDDLQVVAKVDEREISISQATARAGGGTVSLTARAPLRGFEVGELSARLTATDVRLPVIEGVDMSTNAELVATWAPPLSDGPRRKVLVTGNVGIASFVYTRPITISADFDSLAKRGKRTSVSLYDPDDDTVDFAISVRALQPLVFRNNLLEAEVVLDSDALTLSGSNQRFGLRGQMRVVKGGRIRLRSNEFDIRQGTIRFDDPTRIAPRVDLTASTDYRRYTSSSASPAGASTGAPGAGGAGRAGGSWRITLHAHGDADDLKLDLASEPDLAQEDLVLLLTIGMTRAELDQLQAANLGSTAALEALSALSGADSAVKTAIPIIDDFRFGSAYSTRTGRTEPTVTVGKRISDRLRANIITGLSENRDVRSNVEWRITPNTSLLGNYDNLNDVTSKGLGNLGADFRIRLEF
jgi:translocation and assembly module TamB